ncbi:DUF3761 domain-containing protein [Enterobacter ludwigii]|uniref:DUF3761 domain-containing protein n=1 Tax=Enterobacter TaxID=547 RepID=UPI002FCF85AD
MRKLPLVLIVCGLIWSAGTMAASPAKKDVQPSTDVQTIDTVAPKKAPRLHLKQKTDEAITQPADTTPDKAVRDNSGRFVKKDKVPTVSTPAPAGTESGATARCQDGTFSHSKQHSGSCSRHGGVAQWLTE